MLKKTIRSHKTAILEHCGYSCIEYVRAHQDYCHSTVSPEHHALEELVVANLDSYLVPANAQVYVEVGLYTNRTLTIIDVVAICDDQLYLMELKAVPEKRNRAIRPLKRGCEFFERIFGKDPSLILVYPTKEGTYSAERILYRCEP